MNELSIAVGLLSGLVNLDRTDVLNYIKELFAEKGDDTADKNAEAADSGYEIATNLLSEKAITLEVSKPDTKPDNIMVSGAEAIAIGAIAGGCDCAFAYPMSPGTSVFTAMATYSHTAGILVEQTEDEIAAVNMAVAGWYAGARPIVSTSGGGFALMTEGMSLAGITESPLVIHIAQRPGPATGIPTRTEQGDVTLALYAGHGVFEEPFNPLAVAISLGATFAAKSSVHEKELTKELIKQAIQHDGFALVDVFQACVSFNKVNTNQWFKDNTYILGNDYDTTNRVTAFEKSLEREPWPLGLIYTSDSRTSYSKNVPMFENDSTPLYRRKRDISVITKIMESKK